MDLSGSRTVLGPLPVGRDRAGLVLNRLFLSDDATYLELSSTGTTNAGAAKRARQRRGSFAPSGASPDAVEVPPIQVADDRGAQVLATTGTRSDPGSGWSAHFVAHGPLALTTAWLDVDGERVELPPLGPEPGLRTEAVPSPAEPLKTMLFRYLVGTSGGRVAANRLSRPGLPSGTGRSLLRFLLRAR